MVNILLVDVKELGNYLSEFSSNVFKGIILALNELGDLGSKFVQTITVENHPSPTRPSVAIVKFTIDLITPGDFQGLPGDKYRTEAVVDLKRDVENEIRVALVTKIKAIVSYQAGIYRENADLYAKHAEFLEGFAEEKKK